MQSSLGGVMQKQRFLRLKRYPAAYALCSYEINERLQMLQV